MTSKKFLGFRHKPSGALVRLAHDEHEGEDTSESYYLSLEERHPVFTAESAKKLAEVLFDDTPGYNTSEEVPGWGGLKAEDLEPVSVVVHTEVTPITSVELEKPFKLKSVDTRSIPRAVAKSYVGAGFAPKPGLSSFVFWMVEMPAGETLESVQRMVGHTAFSRNHRFAGRHVYAMVAAPEEYREALKGKEGLLVIASEFLPQ